MDRISRFLKSLSLKRRKDIDELVEKIINGNLKGLNCKKLRCFFDIYRVKKGSIRILFQKDKSRGVLIIFIEKRKE